MVAVKWTMAVAVFSFFAASVVYNVRISLFSSSIFSPLIVPSSNCALLLILYINYIIGTPS